MRAYMNGYAISAPFGSIDPSHPLPHKGIDFAIPQGTPVPSIGHGIVTMVSDEGNISFGKSVHVHMSNGTEVIYGHLSQFNVKVGQYVHTGDVIGLSGNTGDSTGAHLHLQMIKNGMVIDPNPYINHLTSIHKNVPFWDLQGWIKQQLYDLCDSIGHGIVNALDVVLPTLAAIGVLWWMFPFLPKSEKAPKLIGSSLIIYMFYVLLKEA